MILTGVVDLTDNKRIASAFRSLRHAGPRFQDSFWPGKEESNLSHLWFFKPTLVPHELFPEFGVADGTRTHMLQFRKL